MDLVTGKRLGPDLCTGNPPNKGANTCSACRMSLSVPRRMRSIATISFVEIPRRSHTTDMKEVLYAVIMW